MRIACSRSGLLPDTIVAASFPGPPPRLEFCLATASSTAGKPARTASPARLRRAAGTGGTQAAELRSARREVRSARGESRFGGEPLFTREERLFLLADALLCPLDDSDALLFELLSGLGACPKKARSAQQLQEAREALRLKGAPYLTSRNSGMDPGRRFELCREGVADPELGLFLSRFCLDKARLKTPDGLALAQTVALYQNREEVFRERWAPAPLLGGRIAHVQSSAPSQEWWAALRPFLKSALFADMAGALYQENSLSAALAAAAAEWRQGRLRTPPELGVARFAPALASLCLWQGQLAAAGSMAAGLRAQSSFHANVVAGMLELVQASRASLGYFSQAIQAWRQAPGSQGVHLGMNIGLCWNLARLLYGGTGDFVAMRRDLAVLCTQEPAGAKAYTFGRPGFLALRALDCLNGGDRAGGEAYLQEDMPGDRNFLSVLLYRGARIRFGIAGRGDEKVLRAWHRASRGFPLVQRLFADLLCRLLPEDGGEEFQRGPAERGLLDFGALACDGDSWNRRLAALERLAEARGGAPAQEGEERLVWIVDWSLRTVRPAVQRRTAFGWSQAAPAQLASLARHPESYGFLDLQDVRILEQAAADQAAGGQELAAGCLRLEDACQAMDGCPRVFEASGQGLAPLALRQGRLAYRLNSYGRDMCRLAISDPDVPDLLAGEGGLARGGRLLVRRGQDIVFYSLSGPASRMAGVVGSAFVFPAGALNRVLSLAGRLAPEIPVEADIEAAWTAPDATPVLQLEQVEDGFAARTGVRPFGRPDTPFYPTGEGVREPFAAGVQDGESPLPRPLRTRRDFAEERGRLAELARACPALGENLEGRQWASSQPDDVLELLTQLGGAKIASRVEWPRGSAVKVAGVLSARSFRVRIEQSDSDWFGVSGEVQIDENRFLSIQAFLRSLKGSRFVALGEGEYVALTEELRRKLSGLQLMLCENGAGGFGVNPLALKSLEQAMEGMQVDADGAWSLSRERMSRAFSAKIALPRGLKAELRDYQREGYEWLQRLALWGVGACLADDMGLGKTLQTIACMLGRAKEGPCLVLAPTSVCANWEAEIARFAPGLRTKRLGASGRGKAIAGMRKGQVLVVGYGLLPFVDEDLAKVEWAMLVLDEAQALKNAQTRRARSARMLRAGFKCALTGTPIENRIDDLWSIFSIVNPGLLGSFDAFRKRWGGAQPGSAASRTLRALVRPFILRRLKSAVLSELPPRTEQTLVVEPSDEERAFYEAERRKAVDRIASLDEGRKRFDILASLMKLRRACCDPSLADPDMAALGRDSSKTERFLEMAQELVGAGHRLLAFSQFTSYLRMVEEALKERGLSCLYLDGSTPEKERRARVKAFQAGGGDVFLLSLKAGGTGINLTAADYVVHLDPWWNPAVEDQASDRAYRLGQKRPVTVYRLVVADTVEEKILAMHERKRGLAADFLEGGAGGAGPLTEQELLDLLQ